MYIYICIYAFTFSATSSHGYASHTHLLWKGVPVMDDPLGLRPFRVRDFRFPFEPATAGSPAVWNRLEIKTTGKSRDSKAAKRITHLGVYLTFNIYNYHEMMSCHTYPIRMHEQYSILVKY